jgi:hypothetical protein
MLPLHRRRRDVAFAGVGLLPGSGLRPDASTSTVVADTINGIHDRPLVDVVDDGDVYIVHSRVIEELTTIPVTAFVADSDVAVTVVDSSIEADIWAPISNIPEIRAVRPSPIARCPEKTDLGRRHPCSGNPEIASIIVIGPITGRPDITFPWANRLRVNHQWRWSDRD